MDAQTKRAHSIRLGEINAAFCGLREATEYGLTEIEECYSIANANLKLLNPTDEASYVNAEDKITVALEIGKQMQALRAASDRISAALRKANHTRDTAISIQISPFSDASMNLPSRCHSDTGKRPRVNQPCSSSGAR